MGKAFVENNRGKNERAERAEKLQRLRERDAEFLDGHVVENVRDGDAEDGGNDQDEVNEPTDLHRCGDVAEGETEREKKGRGDETNEPETADGTELH